jgi:flagellar hook protein FlgE
MNINSSISSINAHQSLLNSSAHNIANSNTDKFERVETNIVQKGQEGVEAINEKSMNNSPYSNTDLVKEMTNQVISYHAVGANSVSIKTQNETADTILDIYA